jgi:hypothetical protein
MIGQNLPDIARWLGGVFGTPATTTTPTP